MASSILRLSGIAKRDAGFDTDAEFGLFATSYLWSSFQAVAKDCNLERTFGFICLALPICFFAKSILGPVERFSIFSNFSI